MIQSLTKKQVSINLRSSATVVNGSLVLSLPDALNPVVWRMELGSVKASAIEIREKENAVFFLVLKTPRGENHDIASFRSREAAVDALMEISAALCAGDTHPQQPVSLTPVSSTYLMPGHEKKNYASGFKWLAALLCVIAVIILFSYLGQTSQDVANTGRESTATTVTGEPNAESGVPQSADQMLRGF